MAGHSSLSSDSDEPIAEINVVPLVDIILVVLIIFMVTAPLVLKPTIDVNLPQASSGQTKENSKAIQVVINKTGELQINGSLVSLDQLKTSMDLEAKKSETSSVILTADREVTLSQLTEIIDAIKSSGIKKVGFSVEKK